MINYLFRHNKDYSRFNIIKQLLQGFTCEHPIYILLPFSKNQFFKHFFKRKYIINDFFISNYDTYVYDRKKITKYNPRAWWKFFQDWFNFRYSKYLLSDTQAHFEYWQSLFGPYKGKHFVLPVLADKTIYYPSKSIKPEHEKVSILFYGSFIPLHGIDIILNAFHLLEKEQIPFEATIIGKGQTYQQMKQLYNELHLQNVTMDGTFIKETELAKKIREADIVLGIFGESTKAKSVIPNKAYQALASRKALITMHSDTLYEFLTDEDMLTCQNTPESLAEAMKKLLLNPQFIATCQQNGYNRFLSLYDKTQHNFIQFIQSIDTKKE